MWRTRSFLRRISTVLATFPMEERARAPLPVMARRGCREGIGHVAACVVVACLSLVRAGAAWPQETGALADQVEAAYVHKFAGYIEWPPAAFEDDQQAIVICVAGSRTVFTELARMAAERPVQRRPVQVREVTRAEQAAGAHMLFIGRDSWKDASRWVAAEQGRPVAVVTDAPAGLQTGALLALVKVEDRIRFEASLPAARQAGLRLSSRLLAVAQRVIGPPP